MATLLAEKLVFGPFHVFAEAAAAGVTFLDDRPSSITGKKKPKKKPKQNKTVRQNSATLLTLLLR